MGNVRRILSRLAAVAAVLTLGVSAAAPALAHNSLTGSTPKDKQRLSKAPGEVVLRFLSPPDEKTTKITLVDPDGEDVSGGRPTFDGKKVTIPLAPSKAGEYTASYELVSDDTHPVKGKVTFRLTKAAVRAAASPSPSPTASATASPTAAPAPAGNAVVQAQPAASTTPDSGFNWWWVVAGAVVLGLAGLA
ncbi:MAG TPA: copper resistance CopC family protein, partial [Pilimelia sp.]|nr:copper resistance CopC family protein [Pilimelia sp.]